MAQETQAGVPASPENQDEEVREELDQEFITHRGDYRTSKSSPTLARDRGKHLGATDDEVVPVTPPMAGPADLVGEKKPNAQGNESGTTEVGEESIDPRDELTPG